MWKALIKELFNDAKTKQQVHCYVLRPIISHLLCSLAPYFIALVVLLVLIVILLLVIIIKYR
jgi:hypothetical protein